MATAPVASYELLRRIDTKRMSISLTLALKDGALGTTPLSHQQTAISLLRADVPYVAAAIPRILTAGVASLLHRWQQVTWNELRETTLYFLLSLLELQLLLSIPLLCLVVPGLILVPWLGLQIALIWVLLRRINSGRRSFKFAADKLGDGDLSSEEERFDWFIVGGLIHNNRLRQELPPKLTKIFGHDMHVFLPQRLGFVFDTILTLLRRNLDISTAESIALYGAVRASLLKPETSGVRILAHHTGALDVSWLLARLCADFPPGKRLSKLQVFTFGAASIEMTLPLGVSEDDPAILYPLVTHFAFADDPVAQIGVLLGIRQRLEGRFIGSLYTIHSMDTASTKSRLLPRDRHYTLNDYLDALLPGGDPRAGVLHQVCKIERELSEMRELAALAQSVTNERLRTRRTRLSWNTIANGVPDGSKGHDDMARLFSLEEVRERGKSLKGMRGFENNPLANAVNENPVLSRHRVIDIETAGDPEAICNGIS
ncbi:hypothetical protein GGS26DRAFT_75686 [Hypomontagnella submonticulosa]|nr:hypothetical protein GGS26DRAFT_75686 [Hypomontagnella submonticulosa]